jgi:hypothetical protein
VTATTKATRAVKLIAPMTPVRAIALMAIIVLRRTSMTGTTNLRRASQTTQKFESKKNLFLIRTGSGIRPLQLSRRPNGIEQNVRRRPTTFSSVSRQKWKGVLESTGSVTQRINRENRI